MSAMLLLKNGAVIDGTGSPQRRADVLISGERIVEIGEFETPSACRVIDCSGLIVAPGFIDAQPFRAGCHNGSGWQLRIFSVSVCGR